MTILPAYAIAPTPSLSRLVAPTTSVVICNHNYARFLPEAIESALAQRPRCQVVVVDDGSTDGSRDFLKTVGPQVEVVLQTNGGQLSAYNTGFAQSTGEVVIFLDADDALQPHAARALAALFDEDVVKVHCRMDLVDEAGASMGATVPSTLPQGDVGAVLLSHGVLYPSAPGSGNAYRRSVLEHLFPLPVDSHDLVGADFFTIYGSVLAGKVAACDAPLVRYRIHRSGSGANSQHAGNPVDPAVRRDAVIEVGEPDLVFGNAAQGNDEAAKVALRYERMAAWLFERSQGAWQLPREFLDFSVQKGPFAMGVLGKSYWEGLVSSRIRFDRLMRSLWLQPAFSWKKRLGLSLWALLVVVLPRPLATPLARYVCNPASRRSN